MVKEPHCVFPMGAFTNTYFDAQPRLEVGLRPRSCSRLRHSSAGHWKYVEICRIAWLTKAKVADINFIDLGLYAKKLVAVEPKS